MIQNSTSTNRQRRHVLPRIAVFLAPAFNIESHSGGGYSFKFPLQRKEKPKKCVHKSAQFRTQTLRQSQNSGKSGMFSPPDHVGLPTENWPRRCFMYSTHYSMLCRSDFYFGLMLVRLSTDATAGLGKQRWSTLWRQPEFFLRFQKLKFKDSGRTPGERQVGKISAVICMQFLGR